MDSAAPLPNSASALKPYADKIVVKKLAKELKSPGGLKLPSNSKEKPNQGEVIAVGPGPIDERTGQYRPMNISPGDKLLYPKYSGTEVTFAGVNYLILSEKDVLATF